MDADWSRVVIVPAAPDDKIYGNPGFRGLMYTAGSATVTGYWDVARTFGAQVRRGGLANAARAKGVAPPGVGDQPRTGLPAQNRPRAGDRASAARCPAPSPPPTRKPEGA